MPKRKKQRAVKTLDGTGRVDYGTPELKRRMPVVIEGEGSRSFARVLNHPLDRYHRRQEITLEQYTAGCTLFNDYAVSHANKTTLTFLGLDQGIATRLINYDNPHTAFERYMRAMKSFNKVSQQLAVHVCIEGLSLKEIHTEMGWRALNTGMDRLCELLDDLIDFYADERRQASMDRKREESLHQFSA